MVARFTGALARAILIIVLVSTPVLLLHSTATTENVLLIALLGPVVMNAPNMMILRVADLIRDKRRRAFAQPKALPAE